MEVEEASLRLRLQEALLQNRVLTTRVQQLEQQQLPESCSGTCDGRADATATACCSGRAALPLHIRHQEFINAVTVQPPRAPLQLPFVTAERVKEVCDANHLACLMFRLAEAPPGMSVAHIMRDTDTEFLRDPANLPSCLQFASSSFMGMARCGNVSDLAKHALKLMSSNAAFRHEWDGHIRNLRDGRLHSTICRGVVYNKDGSTSPQVVVSMVCAELEPSTGKTYLGLMRLVEVLGFEDQGVRYAAMQDMMALKYSPSIVLVVCPQSGHILWQNSASCSAMGIIAAEVALPVAGSCEPCDMNYLQQVFWDNDPLRRQMQATTSSGQVFRQRCQIKGPQLRELLGVVSPRRELWHHVQCSMLKDPLTHQQVYVMSQFDVTEVVLAERRVKQLQKQQMNLLKEMLPPQVIDALLSQDGNGALKHAQHTPGTHAAYSAASAAANAALVGEEAWAMFAAAAAPFDRSSFASSSHSSPLRADTGTGATSAVKPESAMASAISADLHNTTGAYIPSNLSQMRLGTAAGQPEALAATVDWPPQGLGEGGEAGPAEHPLLAQGLEQPPHERLSADSQGSAFLDPAAAAVALAAVREAAATKAAAAGAAGAGRAGLISFAVLQSASASEPLPPAAVLKSGGGHNRSGHYIAGCSKSRVLSRAIAASMRVPVSETPLTRMYCSEWNKPSKSSRMAKCELRTMHYVSPIDEQQGLHVTRQASMPDSRAASGQPEQPPAADQEGGEEGVVALSNEETGELTPVAEVSDGGAPPSLYPEPSVLQIPERTLSSFAGSDSPGLHLSRRDVMALATWHEEVTILFTDLKGFTSMSSSLHPSQVMLFLNHLYSIFDDLVTQFDVYKVETIGDSYMVAAGLFDRSGLLTTDEEGNVIVGADVPAMGGQEGPGRPFTLQPTPTDVLVGAELVERTSVSSATGPGRAQGPPARNLLGGHDADHAVKLLAFAKAMSAAAANVIDPLGNRVQMRVGIHTGSVMSGVVGRKCPRFCLFGDTVNTASRMESTGEPGRIHVSQAFRDLHPHEPWIPHEVFAKGKGALTTYLLDWEPPIVAAPFENMPQTVV